MCWLTTNSFALPVKQKEIIEKLIIEGSFEKATASGKTALAVRLAVEFGGEVISADSRQVYRGMDIGTGKDIEEYVWRGQAVPYHLIDIVAAGSKYNVFEYQKDFVRVSRSTFFTGFPDKCNQYTDFLIKNRYICKTWLMTF